VSRRRRKLLADPSSASERFGLTVWDGLTVGIASLGALIGAKRAFAEPWHAAIGALIGGSIAVVAAQGYAAYERHRAA
jgi:hypothetical protein